jgi:hypothetical protein
MAITLITLGVGGGWQCGLFTVPRPSELHPGTDLSLDEDADFVVSPPKHPMSALAVNTMDIRFHRNTVPSVPTYLSVFSELAVSLGVSKWRIALSLRLCNSDSLKKYKQFLIFQFILILFIYR